jgi:signal transduction histidine kinase
MSLFAISCIITASLTAILGLLTLLKNPRDRINKSWFFVSVGVFLWTIGLFGTVVVNSQESALFWQRILYIGTIIIPVLFFRFCAILLKKGRLEKVIFYIGFILAIIFLILLFNKNFITISPERTSLNYWPVKTGFLYWPFLFYFAFYVIYSVVVLKISSKKNSGIYQKQIQFVYYAALIGFVGGSTNFLLDFDLSIYPTGNLFVSFYVVMMAYAVFKYHLMNIRLIATEILTGLVGLILLIDLLLSDDLPFILLKSGILIVFVYLGISLIRSVLKEIELKERIKKAYEIEKRARKEVEQVTEAKTQFIMATQHHLRTPLTSMIGYLDLIFGGTYGKVPLKLKTTLLKFQVSTKRLIRVVNTLLDISQFQLGKKVVSLKPGIRFENLIKEVVEELQFEVKIRDLYLNYEKKGVVPAINADPEKLKVALFNIIDNGIKYTQKGGLKVKLEKVGSNVQLSIKDTGMGIKPDQAKKLFKEAFSRGSGAKKAYGLGRGIGLYVTAHIIKGHNGKIWAESEGKGRGSTFFIQLPVV